MATKTLSELYLFACKSNSKVPAAKFGYKSATQGFNIQEACERGLNIGLALEPSGLIAIDMDVESERNLNGVATIAKLEKELGELPATLTQVTPRGGIHKIYTNNGIISPRGKIGADVDVKYNGYVLFAPSMINFKSYQIVQGLNTDYTLSIADLPPTWLNYINTKSANQTVKTVRKVGNKYNEADVVKIFESCAFLRHCKENAQTLSEPQWHTMISLLVYLKDGEELIHSLSEPYSAYSFAETQKKIEYAKQFGFPKTCEYISNNYPEICAECTTNTIKKEI